MKKPPPDLPETYRRLLVRINQSSVAVQSMVQKCLLFIAYAEPQLKILELRQVISTPDEVGALLSESNTISENEISRRCCSLIRKSQDGDYFEFAQFSVREFLEDRMALLGPDQLEMYFINSQIGERTFAIQSLRFFQLKNFDKQPSRQLEASSWARARITEFPFYHDAALRCAGLLSTGPGVNDQDDADLWALVVSLFRPQKTPNFAAWASQITAAYFLTAIMRVEHADSNDKAANQLAHEKAWDLVSDDNFTPLHVAAALNTPELCSHLLDSTEPSRGCEESVFGPFDLAVMTLSGLTQLK